MDQPDPNTEQPIQKYMENATAEEQRKFANAFLDGRARADAGRTAEVSPRAVRISRILSLIVFATALIAMFRDGPDMRMFSGLFLISALAWFPNQMAAVTGRFGGGPAISRPSHPWAVLVLAWGGLILYFAFALVVLTWNGS